MPLLVQAFADVGLPVLIMDRIQLGPAPGSRLNLFNFSHTFCIFPDSITKSMLPVAYTREAAIKILNC